MGISTHVLDTTLGRPAEGVAVRLEFERTAGEWELIGSGETDLDGRCKTLMPANAALEAGVYRLHFKTGDYFERLQVRGLYPYVGLVFIVREPLSHYHIPLLLSPNGYTTYRGS
jgi:5-hydroxyisourate hydrolase